MRKDYTHITILIDKSGSMCDLRSDVIGNFKKFIEEQKKVNGKATLTVVLFDTDYKTIYNGVDIQQAEPLTEKTYSPSGMTALLDASAKAIDETGEFLSSLPEEERPEKVIFVTQTDGLENSSVKYSWEDVKKRVQHQSNVYKWEFVFFGANIDSYSVGQALGVNVSHIMNFSPTRGGHFAMTSGYSCKVTGYRMGVYTNMGFTADEKTAVETAV